MPDIDEAAIERGAQAVHERFQGYFAHVPPDHSIYRDVAEAVLRAALEPSSGPERTMDRP